MDEQLQRLAALGIPRDRALIFLMGADMASRSMMYSTKEMMRYAVNNLIADSAKLKQLAETD